MAEVKRGERISLLYESREFEVIVIDPNGLGKGRPSIGFGLTMMERYGSLPQSTSSQWVETHPNNEQKFLKVPSGKTFEVIQINDYLVVEVSDWVAVASDVLKNPGKVRKPTRDGLIDFLGWFAVKGFYADTYAVLKGSYTEADSRAVSAWMQVRLSGISGRNKYTKFLQEQGCEEWYEYANWTDYVYQALFGMKKKQIVEVWDLVEGDRNIGRNYISQIEGLEAVAYCEKQVIELFHANLQQAHDDAINFAKRKFKL
jgi:hypothetical protein